MTEDEACSIIPPRQDDIIPESFFPGYLASCILKGVHGHGPHVFRTPDGEYWAWEDDMNCSCCKPEEEDRCIVYWEIDPENLEKYQNGGEDRPQL